MMGMALRPMAGMMMACYAGILVGKLGYGDVLPAAAVFIIVVVGFAFGYVVYYLTPMPSHNGGWGLPPAQMQEWGLTTEPVNSDKSVDVSPDELLSWRPGILGIYWASNQPSEEGDGDD
jgi:hypothetical protein